MFPSASVTTWAPSGATSSGSTRQPSGARRHGRRPPGAGGQREHRRTGAADDRGDAVGAQLGRPARRWRAWPAPGSPGAAGPRSRQAAATGRRVSACGSSAAREALSTASAYGTVGGSSPRTCSVEAVVDGTKATGARSGAGRGARPAGPSGVVQAKVDPAEQAGGDVVGVALELVGEVETALRRRAARRRRRPARGRRRRPRRWPPTTSRGRGRAGSGWCSAGPARPAARRAGRRPRAATARRGAARRAARRRRPRPRPAPRAPEVDRCTTTSSYRSSARPALSKPGPRLALVAGTRTCTDAPDGRCAARQAAPAQAAAGVDGAHAVRAATTARRRAARPRPTRRAGRAPATCVGQQAEDDLAAGDDERGEGVVGAEHPAAQVVRHDALQAVGRQHPVGAAAGVRDGQQQQHEHERRSVTPSAR